jgi:pimeloyl-ACP methyl ester carboxylesterase
VTVVARFVFVHGAFMGAWCWNEVAALLRARGHRADVLDLPGAGKDTTPPGEVTLKSCVGRVCSVLAQGGAATLVGHSLGGVAVTQAAARCGRQVERLVYIAAFVPAHGQTGRLAGDSDGERLRRRLVLTGEPPVATLPEAAAREVLFPRCDEATARWAAARLTPQPASLSGTPVDLRGMPAVPRSYIVCTGDTAIDPVLQRRMARDTGCEIAEIDTDHSPFLSAPRELCARLLTVATAAQAAVASAEIRSSNCDA